MPKAPVPDTASAAHPIAPASITTGKAAAATALVWIIGGAAGVVALIAGVWWIVNALNTVSTDDAYVNGHVTFVAPRVAGQVVRARR